MTIKNNARICLMVSCAVMVIALLMSLFGLGFRFGVDFAGGMQLSYPMNESFEQADVIAALKAGGVSAHTIAKAGSNGDILQIRLPAVGGEAEIQTLKTNLESALSAKYPSMDITAATVQPIGPVASTSTLVNAMVSVLLACVFVFLFLLLRIDLNSGITVAFGLIHDVLLMMSFAVIFRVQVNASFAAAIVAVAGYSLLSTLALLGSIRKNRKLPDYAKLPGDELVNVSVQSGLSHTAAVFIAAIVLLVALCILSAGSVRVFILPIIVGVLCSAYSTSMISGYAWAFLEERRRQGKSKTNRKAKKA